MSTSHTAIAVIGVTATVALSTLSGYCMVRETPCENEVYVLRVDRREGYVEVTCEHPEHTLVLDYDRVTCKCEEAPR